MYRRCAIIKKEGEAHLKDKKLKRTAIFIGIFAAVILLSIIFMRIFRPPPEPEPLFPTTGEITSTTEESTAEEESTTEPPEWTTEPTTATMPDMTTRITTATRTTTRNSTAATRTTTAAPRPATTRAPATTTRAPATTTKPPATTTRTTTRATTTTRTTTRPTTTRPPTTTARPPTTTSAADSLIAYGIDYGKSIGLTYRPQLTQGGEAISGATQEAIRGKLDQAKASGAKEFNVYSTRQGNTQTLYIIWKR